MLQALFRDFYASAFLNCCAQAQHPSCAKLFHIQFLMQNISYTFFWNAYSLSNFTHFHPPVIQYDIVHLFNDFWCCCTFWTSFMWIIFKAGTSKFNPLNAKFNPICHLLALLGAHHILHVSRIRVKLGSPFLNCWKRRRRVPINFYEFRMNFIWH